MSGFGTISRIKPYVSTATLQTIYKALIRLCFNYCSPLWDGRGKTLQDEFKKFQSRSDSVIIGASYYVWSADSLEAVC